MRLDRSEVLDPSGEIGTGRQVLGGIAIALLPLTCEQARTRAITIVAAACNGQDPAAERDAGRKAITIKELAEP